MTRICKLIALVAALGTWNAAWSQSSQEPAAVLEEVLVTAQARKESLQDVPISLTVLTGETLEKVGVDSFYDYTIPGVNIQQGGMSDNAFIRGIGQSSGNFGIESSAPFYVDGAYYGKSRATRLAFLDVGSVEVLKGPQPIYLGKNAIAGALNINSRRPSANFEASVSASYELEAAETELSATVSGPLTDNLRGRAVAKFRKMDDGWIRNTFIADDEPKQEDEMARVSLVWDASASVQVFVKAEYANLGWDGRATQQFGCLPTAPINPVFEDCVFNTTRAVNFDPAAYPTNYFKSGAKAGDNFLNDLEQTGGQVEVTWDASFAELKSVTSYYSFTNKHFSTPDHGIANRGVAEFVEEFDQLSQELRFVSKGDEGVQWLVGAYYDTANNDDDTQLAVPSAMNMATLRFAREDAESWAVFGEVGLDFSESIKAKIGGRYSENKKTFSFEQVNGTFLPGSDVTVTAGGFNYVDRRYDDGKFQPSVVLEWRPLADTMVYASYKKGFKSGGFDHQPTAANLPFSQLTFKPESADAYEIGLKSTLAEGRVRFNAALFDVSFADLQVSSLNVEAGQGFITTNAGRAKTKGLEFDVAWLLNEDLTLAANVALLDGKYDRFTNAQCYQVPAQTAAQGCIGGVQDLSGKTLQYAPEYAATLSAEYSTPLSNTLRLFFRTEVFLTDDQQLNSDGDPDTVQKAYEKLDARIGIGSLDGRWQAALVGRNLTDEIIAVYAAGTPLNGNSHFGILDRTRQVAIQLRYNFE